MLIEAAIAQEIDRLNEVAAKRAFLKKYNHFHKFDRDWKCEYCGLLEKEYRFSDNKTICSNCKRNSMEFLLAEALETTLPMCECITQYGSCTNRTGATIKEGARVTIVEHGGFRRDIVCAEVL